MNYGQRCKLHTYPWVVPQGMSHPKFLWPIQLQENIGLTWRKLFIPKYLSKDYPSHVEFKTLIKFTKNVFWCGKWMHNGKKLGISNERFFLSITQKESNFLGISFGY